MQRGSGETPLHLRIYTHLKQRIEAGTWGYGVLLPSENELCEEYHISRGTVRLALAGLEQEGLVRRERGRGTFSAFTSADRPAGAGGQKSISFIVPYVRDSYVPSILVGLEREARAHGYMVMFHHAENDVEKQDQVIWAALQQHVAGIVLYPVNSASASPILHDLIDQRIPLVLVDRYIPGLSVDYVSSANFGGGLMATQHLLALGHRRIAFLKWAEVTTAFEHRCCGYRQALVEAGVAPDPDLEWELQGYPEIDQAALIERLRRPDPPTAIFAANDQLAIAVQRAARALNWLIPRDLSLVGYDDLGISANLDIPLTTVAQPADEIGRAAWTILYQKMTGAASGVRREILPVRLVVRESCGALAVGITP